MNASIEEIRVIKELSRRVRILVLKILNHTGLGHAAADLSATDLLTTLYAGVLRGTVEDVDRDRFILSKCHAAAALYSVLSEKGYFSSEELLTFGQANSRLCTVVSTRTPGVELSTGALGHGMSFAVGAAIAAKMDGSSRRIYVLTGDGELQEGSNWEAAMLAATKRLNNLTLIVDRNRFQKGASTEEINALEPLAEKFSAFGWSVQTVDGHDIESLLRVFRAAELEQSRPTCVLAETIKGKGISFMEQRVEWHSKRLTDKDFEQAINEIVGGGNE